MLITINTRKSSAISEWQRKEEGSYEDHNRDQSHVFAILNRWGGRISLTIDEANTLIKSGSYQSTAWEEDEIKGGFRTMNIIANYCKKIKQALDTCPVS